MSKRRDRETTEPITDPVVTPVDPEDTPIRPGALEPFATIERPEVIPVEPAKVEKAAEPSDLMALRVYATIAGPKWDQMAGFVSWARRQNLGPLSMAQWTAEYENFKNRPIG